MCIRDRGKRLRLHPDDLFAYGMDRGGICERWLGSVTVALNGPKTGETEGMSFVVSDGKQKRRCCLRMWWRNWEANCWATS